MKFKSQHIIASEVFSEICEPKKIIQISELNCLLIYHTYSHYKPGTFLSRSTKILSLYDKQQAALKNHIELEFPINDCIFHDESKSLLLSTGQYDGGYQYEGRLLRWNLDTNEVTPVVEDNREFRKLSMIGNTLKVDVMPTDDQTTDSDIKQYTLPIETIKSSLHNFQFTIVNKTLESNFYLDTISNIEKTKLTFNALVSSYLSNYNHSYSANCIKFLNKSQLVIGFNDDLLVIINLLNNSKREIRIEEASHCHQIIPFRDNQLIINFFPIWPPESSSYMLNINGTVEDTLLPNGLIYTNGKGTYVIKQIVPYAENETHMDYLLDDNLKIISEFEIGPYNAYQHHLELADKDSYYFFQGIDDDKMSKKLVQYSVREQSLSTVYTFQEELKLVYPNGIKIGETIYLSFTKHPNHSETKLFALHLLNGEIKCLVKFDAPIVHLDRLNDEVLLYIDVAGNFGKIELPTNKIVSLNERLKAENQKPISFDIKDNMIAIGYNSGTVEILVME